MEIYLIRHTTPKIDKGVCYGQSDIPLADSFLDESEKLILMLPEKIDAVYSSPLIRCFALAEKIVLSAKQKPYYKTDDRLKEMKFGKWEMKRWDDIDKKEFDIWANDVLSIGTPNGESFSDLHKRVNAFIDELTTTDDKTVVVITHAGVIRCFFARWKNLLLKDTFNIPVGYASVNILSFPPPSTIVRSGND
jgi:alpha-ribazole phosphatase